jgi:hypothetical protein
MKFWEPAKSQLLPEIEQMVLTEGPMLVSQFPAIFPIFPAISLMYYICKTVTLFP